MPKYYFVYIVGTNNDSYNKIMNLIFKGFKLQQVDCYFLIHLNQEQLKNPSFFDQLKQNELVICIISGANFILELNRQNIKSHNQVLLLIEEEEVDGKQLLLLLERNWVFYQISKNQDQEKYVLQCIINHLPTRCNIECDDMSFINYEQIIICCHLITGDCNTTHLTVINSQLLKDLYQDKRQLKDFTQSEKNCENKNNNCQMKKSQITEPLQQSSHVWQNSQIVVTQNILDKGENQQSEKLTEIAQDQQITKNTEQEKTKLQPENLKAAQYQSRFKTSQCTSKIQQYEIKILLLSVDEVQDFIDFGRKTKKYSDKNQFLEKKISNLSITKSPIFHLKGEDEEIILAFKKKFQKQNFNCILFCLKFERTDIMKWKLNLMLKRFVGVSRNQLGFIVFTNLKNEEKQNYLEKVQEIKGLKLYGIVNVEQESFLQIEENLKQMFIGFSPSQLDLSQTEFAEETEEDKKQAKQLEQNFREIQFKITKGHIDEIQSKLEKIDKENYEDEQEIKKLQYQINVIKQKINNKTEVKKKYINEKLQLEKQQLILIKQCRELST